MTGTGRRIARNAAALWSAETVGRVFSYLALIFLARRFEVDANGQYALAVTLVGLVASFGDLGLNALTIREVAADRSQASRYLRTTIVWRFASSLFFLGGLAAWGTLAGYEPLLRLAVLVMGIRLVFDGLAGGYVYLLQAHEEMALQGWIVALGSLARFGGLAAVVGTGHGVPAACAVWSAVSAATLVLLWILSLKRGWRPLWADFRWSDAASILRAALPLAIMGSLQTLYFRVDVVMLKSFLDNVSVALYFNAYKLLEAALMFANMAALAALPALSARRDDRAAFGDLAEKLLKILALGGTLVTVVGVATVPDLLSPLFGRPYEAAGPAGRVLFLSAAPFFVNALAVAVLTVRNPRKLVVWYLSLLLVNVGLNFWLIPRWGPVGAAWATFICESGGAVFSIRWILREGSDGAVRRFWGLGPGLLVGTAAVAVGVLRWPGLQWLLMGPVVFLGALVAAKTLGPEDGRRLKDALRPPQSTA